MVASVIPQAFVWRKIHSLMGLWLVLFLMEHLLVNSQVALLLEDNFKGFVDAVNSIHNLPYLQAIEIFLLGVPILVHMIWGIKYLFTSKVNSYPSDGSKPALAEYARNHAYTWQRITSWILVIGIIGHVTKFRFLEYPWSIDQGESSFYFVRIHMDKGLYSVADRLGVKIYDSAAIAGQMGTTDFVKMLEKKPIAGDEVIAVSKDFGTATLLTVRDTFKSPLYVALYTVFVLAACFHGFNGLWTFLITWGVILKMSSQRSAVKWAYGVMFLIAFLGLAAVWGTYWLNLKI
jgi:succinate dehydrogenase / fumarate reductase cytochrome b subunit